MIQDLTLTPHQRADLASKIEEWLNEDRHVASGVAVEHVSRYVQAQGPDLFRVYYSYERHDGREAVTSDYFQFTLRYDRVEDFREAP